MFCIYLSDLPQVREGSINRVLNYLSHWLISFLYHLISKLQEMLYSGSSTLSSDFLIIPIPYHHLIWLVLKINMSSQPYSCLILNYFIWKNFNIVYVSSIVISPLEERQVKNITFSRLSHCEGIEFITPVTQISFPFHSTQAWFTAISACIYPPECLF